MKWRSAFTVLALTLGFGTNVLAKQTVQPDIRSFVRGPLFPQTHNELLASYDADVTPELIAMLNSEAEEEHWAKIAVMLGGVGDERAAEALIAFVEKPGSARLSRWHHDARRAAIRSLGFLVSRYDNKRALMYLIDGLTPSVWRQRNVIGLAPWMSSYEEYDLLLSTYALFGLALSGHPRAGEALRTLQRSPTPEQVQFRDSKETTLTQWLEIHGLVAERGVDAMNQYYRERSQERP